MGEKFTADGEAGGAESGLGLGASEETGPALPQLQGVEFSQQTMSLEVESPPWPPERKTACTSDLQDPELISGCYFEWLSLW